MKDYKNGLTQTPPPERLFTAVRLSPEIRSSLGETCRSLARELPFAKWTHEQDYHITLQFLGDTDPAAIPRLIEALRGAAAGMPPFGLSLKGPGTFGSPGAPRVLWAGVGGDTGKLEELFGRIVTAARPLGFKPEERAYRPHVTLARRYKGDRAFGRDSLDKFAGMEPFSMSWRVEECVLFVTRMHKQPMYEVVETLLFQR